MFCPQCRAEYRQGFTACGHCKVPLVESLAQVTVMDEDGIRAFFKGKDTIMVTQGGLQTVKEMSDVLLAGGCVTRIRPLDEESALHAMFSLDITAADLDRARSILGERWKQMVANEGATPADAGEAVLEAGQETTCPACNHRFTPTGTADAECPGCGLFLGVPG